MIKTLSYLAIFIFFPNVIITQNSVPAVLGVAFTFTVGFIYDIYAAINMAAYMCG